MKTGEKIRELREQRGWSQRELAAMVGYKEHSMIARIESSDRMLSQKKLMAFAKVFDIPAYDLLCVEEEPTPKKITPEQQRTDEARRLLFKRPDLVDLVLALKTAKPNDTAKLLGMYALLKK